MGIEDKKEDNKENAKSSKTTEQRIDIELNKNPQAAKDFQDKWGDFLKKTPEYDQIKTLSVEALKYQNDLLQSFEEQIEAQFTSGKIINTLTKIQNELAKGDYAATERNMGAGFSLPMQLALRHVGYTDLVADAIVGPKTIAALKDFQTKNNLTMSGKFDSATINALKINFAKGLTDPKRTETVKLTPEQVKALADRKEKAENERINTNYKRVLMDYFVNSPTRPKIENLFPNTNLMTNDGEGITSVDFGPKNPNLYTDKAWLDLTKFDFKKNPTITLSLHHNKGNFPGTFNVNVMKFTKQAPDGSVKIDQGKLYALTAANYRNVARAQTNFATPVKKKAAV